MLISMIRLSGLQLLGPRVVLHSWHDAAHLLQAAAKVFLPGHHSLAAHASRADQSRDQLIGAGYHHTSRFRVGVVGRQTPLPCEGVCFCGLARSKGDICHALPPPVVDGITELDSASGAVGRDMEGGGIGHGQIGATGKACDRGWIYRHINTGDLELGSRRCGSNARGWCGRGATAAATGGHCEQ